eukprot:TRINITY_DN2674_c0_g1_i1.p1 TRINITY_DN2674_c0_g1~~TRINITY_DN2674_c0_g1_i1.p1  ORF type:complete len:285 (+),score=31.33 TRINITY_DN2674_c0_g1_i1:59-856(+)
MPKFGSLRRLLSHSYSTKKSTTTLNDIVPNQSNKQWTITSNKELIDNRQQQQQNQSEDSAEEIEEIKPQNGQQQQCCAHRECGGSCEKEADPPSLALAKHSTSEKQCWICLDGKKSSDELDYPCTCPRKVHHKCLAQWQLQSAGKDEEHQCRFCLQVLPDWRQYLTPQNITPAKQAVMVVVINGISKRIKVGEGQGGVEEFTRKVREAFGVSESEELDLSFVCNAPNVRREQIRLQGNSAFDAAVHCAQVSAAQRKQQKLLTSGH